MAKTINKNHVIAELLGTIISQEMKGGAPILDTYWRTLAMECVKEEVEHEADEKAIQTLTPAEQELAYDSTLNDE